MDFSSDRIGKLRCSDGKERRMYFWEPASPSVVFLVVHGGMDHAGNYSIPARYFREYGFATVAYNQRGHDHRGPDHPAKVVISRFDAFMDDLGSALEKTENTYPGLPVFILAHSMGCLISTHFELRTLEIGSRVRGFVFSSPYFVNAIKTPALVRHLAGLFSAVVPGMKAPTEDIIEYVTHDREIYHRHRREQAEGIKATAVSMRLGNELLKAQAWLPSHISAWKHPLLAIVAGDDRLADAASTRRLIGLIDSNLVTEMYFPDNYHENFNELNRQEIFAAIVEWVNKMIGAG